jgi:hypothetical protein
MAKFHKHRVFISYVIKSFSQALKAECGRLSVPQRKSTYRLCSMKDTSISFIASDADVEPGNFEWRKDGETKYNVLLQKPGWMSSGVSAICFLTQARVLKT